MGTDDCQSAKTLGGGTSEGPREPVATFRQKVRVRLDKQGRRRFILIYLYLILRTVNKYWTISIYQHQAYAASAGQYLSSVSVIHTYEARTTPMSSLLHRRITLQSRSSKPGPRPHRVHVHHPFPPLFRYTAYHRLGDMIHMHRVRPQGVCCSSQDGLRCEWVREAGAICESCGK